MKVSTPGEGIRYLSRALRRPGTTIRAHREAAEQRERLAGHRLFAGCTKGELRVLHRWGDELVVPAGVVLLRKDAIGYCVIAVLEGSVRVTTNERRPAEHIGADGWVGDRAVLAFAPQPATVTTETPCRLFALGARPALSFFVDMAGMRSALFPTLDQRGAIEHVRALREEGLASWRTLGRRAPRPTVDPSLPEWLHVYKSRSPRSEAVTSELLRSSESSTIRTPLPERRLQHPRRVAAIAAGLVLALLASIASSVHLPYYSMRGSTRSAIEAVHLGAGPLERSGTILFPIVDVSQVTPLGAVRDWHDNDADVHTMQEILGGQNAADLDHANRQMMADAKRNAVKAVENLLAEVSLDQSTLKIDSGDIGGPSAGLAFALALIDVSTRGDLTGGATIAATGELTPDGVVRAVGGTRLKTLAARRAGCALFVVPLANLEEARGAAGTMRLLGVDSLAEAVQKLVADGGVIEVPRADA